MHCHFRGVPVKIALDCDGVLADFTSGALAIVKEVTGRSYTPAEVTRFDFTEALGLSIQEARAVKKAIGARQGFAASLLPYPGAVHGVRRLREFGDVICVTSPWTSNPWWCEEREAWLAQHFGIEVVHHAEDKSGYEADIFVDDRSSHVRAWARNWPQGTAVFWRTPHNGMECIPDNAEVAETWEELYRIVEAAHADLRHR